jgi:hypothetical protein
MRKYGVPYIPDPLVCGPNDGIMTAGIEMFVDNNCTNFVRIVKIKG